MHVGRWDLLHPEHLHAPVANLKCMHRDKVLLEQDWGLLAVDHSGMSMKEIMEPEIGQKASIPSDGTCVWTLHLRSSTGTQKEASR